MTTATLDRTEQHTYADQDTPMINATHLTIKGTTVYHCIEEECDGVHHVWCSCAH